MSKSIIKALLNRLQESGWSNAEEFQLQLQGIEKLLWNDGDPDDESEEMQKSVHEKLIQLSYEIQDFMADCEINASSLPKGSIRLMLKDRPKIPDFDIFKSKIDEITQTLHDSIEKRSKKENIATHKTGETTSSSQNIQSPPPVPATAAAAAADDLTEHKVKDELLKENPIISIMGIQGMGKTFLAKEVYYHDHVRKHFHAFGWVPIKRDFRIKNVLRTIMLQLLPERRVSILRMGEIKLAQELFTVQNKKKCLIVLEDIWTKEDWWIISMAFPMGQSESKILFTTTSREAAEEVKSSGGIMFEVKPLTEAQCFSLLKKKAGFDDSELEKIGNKIFSLSMGSPLAAIILGKSFKKVDGHYKKQRVVNKLISYQGSETTDMIPRVLSLCYDWLPIDLQWCFLYLGQFPEGHDIQVEKLELLWATDIQISPAENWMEKLIHRYLVQVKEDTSLSKSCRLHHLTRDMCVSKGKEEGLFEVEDFKNRDNNDRLNHLGSVRRLAVYLNKYHDGLEIQFNRSEMLKRIHSLLVFDVYESKQKKAWPRHIYEIKELSHLQILHFDGIDFAIRKFPKGMDKLLLLRYLSFQGCWLENLPPSLSKLKYLETLDLGVRSNCKMFIPNVLNKMQRLKNLYFPLEYASDDGVKKLDLWGLTLLEVLVNFNTEVCNVNDLPGSTEVCSDKSDSTTLRTLTVISEGNTKDLGAITCYLKKNSKTLNYSALDIKNFDCNTRAREAVFKKVLECKSLHSLQIDGKISKLPEDLEGHLNSIQIMIFKGSEFEENAMPILGKLENLRSLELSDDAFVGKEMIFSAESNFPALKILKLLNLRCLESLTFEETSMPHLSTLLIDKCHRLEEKSVPESLDRRLRANLKEKEEGV